MDLAPRMTDSMRRVECIGNTLEGTSCEKVASYPRDHVKRLLELYPDRSIFNSEATVPIVSSRFGDTIEKLCDAKEDVIHPQIGLTDTNEVLYIVNDEDVKQGLRVELCRGFDYNLTASQSNMGDQIYGRCKDEVYVANRRALKCKQGFVFRELLTPGPAKFERRRFVMPACCTCVMVPA